MDEYFDVFCRSCINKELSDINLPWQLKLNNQLDPDYSGEYSFITKEFSEEKEENLFTHFKHILDWEKGLFYLTRFGYNGFCCHIDKIIRNDKKEIITSCYGWNGIEFKSKFCFTYIYTIAYTSEICHYYICLTKIDGKFRNKYKNRLASLDHISLDLLRKKSKMKAQENSSNFKYQGLKRSCYETHVVVIPEEMFSLNLEYNIVFKLHINCVRRQKEKKECEEEGTLRIKEAETLEMKYLRKELIEQILIQIQNNNELVLNLSTLSMSE